MNEREQALMEANAEYVAAARNTINKLMQENKQMQEMIAAKDKEIAELKIKFDVSEGPKPEPEPKKKIPVFIIRLAIFVI